MLFIVGITCFYIFFSWIISKIDLYVLKSYSAVVANFLLNLVGINTQLQFLAEPTILVAGIQAQINNLCAGDLEIALITAIILASWGVTWKKRIVGILGAWATILILNPLRIFIVLAAGSWFNWSVGNFIHDVFFRLMLLAVIAGYYYIWYTRYDKIKAFIDDFCK